MGRIEKTTMHHFSHGHPLQLISFTQAQQPNLKTQCCGPPSSWTNHGRSSSEPLYACEPCNFYVHKSCLQLPQLITHPLTLLPVCPYPGATFSCDACSRSSACFSYNCTHCFFDLHVYCASMPLTVSHGAHPHRLSLSFACPYPEDGDFKCDLCRGRGGSAWLYRCAPCGFDVHLDCARGIGPATGMPVQPMGGPRPVAPTQPTGPYSSAPNCQVGPRPPVRPLGPYAGAQGPALTGPGLPPQFRPHAAQAQPMAWNQQATRPTMLPSLQLNFGNGGGGQSQEQGAGGGGQSQDGSSDNGGAFCDSASQGPGAYTGDGGGGYCYYEAEAVYVSGDGEAECVNNDEGGSFVGYEVECGDFVCDD